ncbi:melanopsin-B-like [Orbicella faveolata]|uniref:melanopsin-B-like n=1 Tax=Orbicella faveolata TaxID=48498 RepID=UPI0009E6095F|nr:melanopsin-B-like [Orbicella faveolata]
MYLAKSLFTKVIMNMLGAVLTSASALGNGFVLATIARFKSLRTVPNILIANLAVVDLLYAAVNLPFHMISNSEASWYRGQTLAIVTAFLSRVFTILNLTSMLAMMANVFLAIAFDFKYLAWKTKKKVMICVVLIWLIDLVVTILGSIPLLNINLADARVRDFRRWTWGEGGSEHRNTAKKINERRITARKVNETPSPQHVFLAS